MRSLILSSVILCASAIGLIAADLEIEENPVDNNSFAVVKYKIEKDDAVEWDVSPEPTKLKDFKDSDYSYCVFNGPTKTRYTVKASIVNFKAERFTKKRAYVVIGGKVEPGPNPNPEPGPNPPVPPDTLVDGPVKLFVVEETMQRTTAVQKLLSEVNFWNELDKQGYSMRVYDISTADAKRLNLDKIKQPVPFMVIAAKDGTVIKDFPLPLTIEEVRKKLPKLRVKISIDDVINLSPVVSVPPMSYSSYPQVTYQPVFSYPFTGVTCVGGVCYPNTDGRFRR